MKVQKENSYYYFVVLTIFNQYSFNLFSLLTTENTNLIFLQENTINYLSLKNTFPVEMATRNKRKLAALNEENCEEHPRSNLAQNSNVSRSQEDYISQVSEEIEGWFTKKLSQEFNRTENRLLGALSRLEDFLMNQLIQGHSGTAPVMSRNAFSTNYGSNEDDSHSDPHPEACIFHNQTTRNSFRRWPGQVSKVSSEM